MSAMSEQMLRDWLSTKELIFGADPPNSSPEADMEVISVYVPESLKVELKVLCMQQKVTMDVCGCPQLIKNLGRKQTNSPLH